MSVASKKSLGRNHRGEFQRRLGTIPGSPHPARFTLGYDEKEAMIRNLRLEQLCGACGGVWDSVGLKVAKAVAKGQSVVVLDPAEHAHDCPLPAETAGIPAYVAWLRSLQDRYAGVTLRLAETKVSQLSEDLLKLDIEHHRKIAAIEKRKAEIKEEILAGPQTLHLSLDAFAEAERSRLVDIHGVLKPSGKRNGLYVRLVKEHSQDMPLSQFGEPEILSLIEYWRKRPLTRKDRPASPDMVKDAIKLIRAFVRWLNKEKRFGWKMPEGLDFPRAKVELTHLEKDRRANPNQVQTYTPEELGTLFEYATPLERCYILLALNCGFGQREICTLLAKDVDLDGGHIRRIRFKTNIYGEWKLWPITVQALKWYVAQRPQCDSPYLFVSRTGKPYADTSDNGNYNRRVGNEWYKIFPRIEKDIPGFRVLSFNKLRKTAGNMVKKVSDGEVAAVFLAHGETNSDEFSDVYTDRDFAKVFEALEKVWLEGMPSKGLSPLAPIIGAVVNPFPADYHKRNGGAISIGTWKKIKHLRDQGHKIEWIAEQLGLGERTIRSYLKRGHI